MICNRTSQYALRALVCLAQVQPGTYASATNIAAAEKIPLYYLEKILQRLARKGLLRSRKGSSGGFALRVRPEDVRLLDIVRVFDGLTEYERCACGLGKCSDDTPCGLHNSWKALRLRIMNYLAHNTVARLAMASYPKRCLLNDRRRSHRQSSKI